MHDDNLKSRTIRATIGYAVFMVLFWLLRNAFAGQPLDLVGPVVSALVGAMIFGFLYYKLMQWRGTRHRA
jgi:hypothetical protein